MSTRSALSSHFGTVNAQGRVVVPIEVRRALGIVSGDRVEFVVQDHEVRLVTPRMRAVALWAQNHGGDGGDSTRDVRTLRSADLEVDDAAEKRVAARASAEQRSDDEIADELFAGLGL